MIGKAGKAEQLNYTYLVFITRKCDFVFAKEMAPPPEVPGIMGVKFYWGIEEQIGITTCFPP